MAMTKKWWLFKLDELWETRNLVGYYQFKDLIEEVEKRSKKELIEEIEKEAVWEMYGKGFIMPDEKWAKLKKKYKR